MAETPTRSEFDRLRAENEKLQYWKTLGADFCEWAQHALGGRSLGLPLLDGVKAVWAEREGLSQENAALRSSLEEARKDSERLRADLAHEMAYAQCRMWCESIGSTLPCSCGYDRSDRFLDAP